MQPGRWGEVPVKSTVISSPATVMHHSNRHRLIGQPIVVHIVHHLVNAVRNKGDGLAGQPFGVVQQGRHMLLRLIVAITLDYLLQSAFADPSGGDLGGKVAFPLFRRAGVSADELNDLMVQPSSPDQLDGRDYGPFLIQLGGQGERAGRHAADIGVVAPIGHEPSQALGNPPVSPFTKGGWRYFGVYRRD